METTLEDEPRQPFSVSRVQQEAWDLLVLEWWESHAGSTASHWVGCGRVLIHSMEGGRELRLSTETMLPV